jgi:sugar phosphate permease
MTAGATIAAFCGYGISSFQSIFLVRAHGITTGEAAIWINTPVALVAAGGTFAAGWLATKLYKKYPGAIAWVPAIGLALSVPFTSLPLRPKTCSTPAFVWVLVASQSMATSPPSTPLAKGS